MSGRLRFAVYRDRTPLTPIYLGDVLAPDRDEAERAGASTYGGRVVAHRSAKPGEVSAALERVVRRVEKRQRDTKRDFKGGTR